jgi:predicted SAM-dependent methyltransferase
MKLDIGCGRNLRPGYVGMDISPDSFASIIWDWENYPWPFEDNSIEEATANHVLEHTKDLIKFMDECYRIMKPGAELHIECPYWTSIGSWQDPTHTRAISEMTFMYFSKGWREGANLGHYPIKANFATNTWFILEDGWVDKEPKEDVWFAIKHYTNVAKSICATLTKI